MLPCRHKLHSPHGTQKLRLVDAGKAGGNGAAFFRIGIIGWQGNFSIKKIDLSAEHRNEK